MVHPNQHIIDALYEGKEVSFRFSSTHTWKTLDNSAGSLIWISLVTGNNEYEFKLKPRMVKLNGYEVIAPLIAVEHGKAVHVLENDGSVYSMFYDCTDKEHQKLLAARSIFSEPHHAQAFHSAFLKMLALQ